MSHHPAARRVAERPDDGDEALRLSDLLRRDDADLVAEMLDPALDLELAMGAAGHGADDHDDADGVLRADAVGPDASDDPRGDPTRDPHAADLWRDADVEDERDSIW